jgi:hypothetical protein
VTLQINWFYYMFCALEFNDEYKASNVLHCFKRWSGDLFDEVILSVIKCGYTVREQNAREESVRTDNHLDVKEKITTVSESHNRLPTLRTFPLLKAVTNSKWENLQTEGKPQNTTKSQGKGSKDRPPPHYPAAMSLPPPFV